MFNLTNARTLFVQILRPWTKRGRTWTVYDTDLSWTTATPKATQP